MPPETKNPCDTFYCGISFTVEVWTQTCDVSKGSLCSWMVLLSFFNQVKKEVGDVSILINNAGIVTGRKFLDCPDELMEKSLDVNFKAHLWVIISFFSS